MIIDIHTHVCDTLASVTAGQPLRSESWGKARRGNEMVDFFPPSFEKSNSPVEMLIAHMDAFGVDKALLMANPLYGYHNQYFIESVKKYPDRLRGVALVDLIKGQKAADELVEIYENTDLFGFKIETYSTFQCAPGRHMGEKEFYPVWEVLNERKQPVFIHMFTDIDVQDVIELADVFPQITFVLCHMGADSCFLGGKVNDNYELLLKLVKTHDNVYFDTSSVPVYFEEEYPFPSSVEIYEKAYREVGAEKMMWSSDYPGMLNHATFRELINVVKKHCDIPEADMDLIMGGNAERLFFGPEALGK